MDYDATGSRVKKFGPLGQTLYPFPGYEIGPDGTKTRKRCQALVIGLCILLC